MIGVGRYFDAPFDREIELAVEEGDSLHGLVFAYRRNFGGWINAQTVIVSPTQWLP
jgi:hypothetical protein